MPLKVRLVEVHRSIAGRMASTRARKLIAQRRPTGVTTVRDLMNAILAEADDDDDWDRHYGDSRDRTSSREDSEGFCRFSCSMPRRITHLSTARQLVQLTIHRRLMSNDKADASCGHKENEWCVCENRFTGYSSTFVDKNQPPYTIWHVGTDFVDLTWTQSDRKTDDFVDLVPVEIFNMTGENGFCVQITNFGARITTILMADNEGFVEEIMPSFPNMFHTQVNAHQYMSGLLGRLGCRVEDGQLHGKGSFFAQLELNDFKKHHINGGDIAGFDRVPWQAAVAGNELVFTLLIPDGESGYPGTALLTARYCVRPPNTLVFRLTVTCTRTCPFAPVLRLPLNLAGHGAGKTGIVEHVVNINASHYFVTDKNTDIPTGRERHVAKTIYDLRMPRSLGVLHPLAPWPGYRTYLRLDGNATVPATAATSSESQDTARTEDADDEDAPLPFAAKLYHPQSRRAVELRTNQPVLYLETARMGMPVDPEDMSEELRRAREERLRIEEELARAAAAEAEEKAARTKETEEEGEEQEGEVEEEGENAQTEEAETEFSHLAFAEKAKQYEIEEPVPLVLGRGGFEYHRCSAITLQPQRIPLFKGKKLRDGTRAPMNATNLLLQPGRRLLYAATWRFYVAPRASRRRRASPVRYAASGERLSDARARFDVCDFGEPISPPPRTPISPERPAEIVEETGPTLTQGDLQADRCSIESIVSVKNPFNRKFIGPPVAEVPPPQLNMASMTLSVFESLIQTTFTTADMRDLLCGMMAALPAYSHTPVDLKGLLDRILRETTDPDRRSASLVLKRLTNAIESQNVRLPSENAGSSS